IIDQLEDRKRLLRRPVVRDLEEHPQVRAGHGCALTRAPSAALRRLACLATWRDERFCPAEPACATGVRKEGPSMVMLMQRCRKPSRRASTRCFVSNSSYQSSSSSEVVMMVDTLLEHWGRRAKK